MSTEQELRDALASLIEVYDAMGAPRGPSRIMAEAALAQPPAQPELSVVTGRGTYTSRPAQPAKLSIQSLWPIMPSGEIDPRSELAKAPAQPVGEAAPANNLPSWSECSLRVDNSDFIAKRVAEGGYGPDHDSELASELHRFIYEYDDADPYHSEWFLHRLELVLNEARSTRSVPEVPAAPSETVALITECRDALAEELAGWDIDPPLHHVKQAHDHCIEWLAAHQAMPAAVEAREHSSGREALADRIRSAIHGAETWRVMNAADSAYCIEFASPEYMNPKVACERWMAEQNPDWIARNGYHAVKSFEYTGAERLALEAANALDPIGPQGRVQAADAAGSDVAKESVEDSQRKLISLLFDDPNDDNSAARKGGEAE